LAFIFYLYCIYNNLTDERENKMATQLIQTRLGQATEKRAQFKANQTDFDLAFCNFISAFNKSEDDLPLELRQAFTKVKKTTFGYDSIKRVLGQKNEKAKAPTEEQKMERMGPKGMQYSRCPCCETPIQNRLMKLHMGRAICQNTATTRLTDVKMRKEDKRFDNPRVPIKDRVAELALKNGLTEETIKELIKEEKHSKVVVLTDKIETELKKRGVLTDGEEDDDEPIEEPIFKIETIPQPVVTVLKKKKKLIIINKL
jgi:protein-arginine kinase activator protein McsA